jgi:hypothetical protein
VNPEDFYNGLAVICEKQDTGEDVGLPMIFVQGIYNNVDFFNSHRVIKNLTNEE